ncbi:hypothetical protein L226DRAFT_330443 [Lentinus tigrinus ALCF2SS1-7]|uniref:uncharacterized protein n=1 Tax=Lentinus tigrinus ALCF2SS1-7 TaxID=1328758 RepID=UPI001165F277|nr:hypothetical protein L226DRAFT_330443 [Lentinus tigrinus ALCF2SS1-7]
MQAAPTYIRDDIYRQTANMMQMPHCRWIASLTSRTADIEAQSRGTTQHYALDSIVSLLPRPQPFSAPRLAGATGLSRLENSSVRSEPPCRLYAIGRRAVSYDYAQSHGPNGLSPMDTALTHRVLQGVPRKKTSSAVGRSSDFSLRDLSGGRSPGVVHVVLARIVCLCRHEIIGGDVVSIYLILFARQASSSMNCLQTSSPTGYPDASRTLPVPVSHLQKSCNRSTPLPEKALGSGHPNSAEQIYLYRHVRALLRRRGISCKWPLAPPWGSGLLNNASTKAYILVACGRSPPSCVYVRLEY